MKHLLETAVIAFPEEHAGRVNAELERLGRLGGDPFEGARKALDDGGFVHFMSLVVAPVLEEECRRRDRSVVVPALEAWRNGLNTPRHAHTEGSDYAIHK